MGSRGRGAAGKSELEQPPKLPSYKNYDYPTSCPSPAADGMGCPQPAMPKLKSGVSNKAIFWLDDTLSNGL